MQIVKVGRNNFSISAYLELCEVLICWSTQGPPGQGDHTHLGPRQKLPLRKSKEPGVTFAVNLLTLE